MINRAFTLIELLIYLALLVMLSLLTFSFASRTYRFMLERNQASHLFVRAMITEDLIRRDIQVASLWLSDWDAQRAIFKQLTLDANGKPVERWIGYEVNSKGLHRREGESSFCLVDSQVTKINLKPITGTQRVGDSCIIVVTVEITNKPEKTTTFSVALRNRVLP